MFEPLSSIWSSRLLNHFHVETVKIEEAVLGYEHTYSLVRTPMQLNSLMYKFCGQCKPKEEYIQIVGKLTMLELSSESSCNVHSLFIIYIFVTNSGLCSLFCDKLRFMLIILFYSAFQISNFVSQLVFHSLPFSFFFLGEICK